MNLRKYLLAAGLLAAIAGSAVAQNIPPAQVQSIGPNDLFLDIPNGQPTPNTFYAPAALLGNFGATFGGNNPTNALIGGDATTNLFQRATTGASVTTAITYGGPDRWAYWSGTATAMTVSRDSTASDLPASGTYQYAFKMARTSGQTGVIPVCMMQEVESASSFALAGGTAEIDFHATAGSNFSAANSTMTAYLITGTTTDEGVSKAAFNLNAGGGGSGQWTGQVNTGVSVPITTATNRYTVAIPVPAATQEVAVALCWTPVGTAGTNDYIAFAGIQLTTNAALKTVAGTAGVALVNDGRAKAFSRRAPALETVLQQRYYYQVTESAAIFPVAPCAAVDTTHTNCIIPVPTPMRIAPALTFANGFATPTSTTQATLGACTTLAAAATVTSTVAGTYGFLVNCTATTVPAAGVASFLYSNNGTGIIRANSEL